MAKTSTMHSSPKSGLVKLAVMIPEGVMMKINNICDIRRECSLGDRFKADVVADAINKLHSVECSDV